MGAGLLGFVVVTSPDGLETGAGLEIGAGLEVGTTWVELNSTVDVVVPVSMLVVPPVV